jgi:hypothetical protein
LTVNQIIYSAAIYCWKATVGQSTLSGPRDDMDKIPYTCFMLDNSTYIIYTYTEEQHLL